MTDETKNPVGRPTSYRPEYCELVVAWMKEGASMAELALNLNVSKSSLYEWMEKQVEFSHAIKKGVDLSRGWWERNGRTNLHCKEFNHVLWYMNMKNRFRADWTDKVEEKLEDKKDEIEKDRELLHKCKQQD